MSSHHFLNSTGHTFSQFTSNAIPNHEMKSPCDPKSNSSLISLSFQDFSLQATKEEDPIQEVSHLGPPLILRRDTDFSLNYDDYNNIDESPVSPGKAKDKFVKRHNKNEKNYKDLNKSLANLALKRITRSSSSDTKALLSEGLQPEHKTPEKSYNFELQPPIFSPNQDQKHSSATANISNLIFNSTYSSINKITSTSRQTSPATREKTILRNENAQVHTKPFYKHETHKSEEDYLKLHRKVPPQITRTNFLSQPVQFTEKIIPEHKISFGREIKETPRKPWSNDKVNFFPGDMDKILSQNKVKTARKQSKSKVELVTPKQHQTVRETSKTATKKTKRISKSPILTEENYSTIPRKDLAFSFKGFRGAVERAQILDSRLPSKTEIDTKNNNTYHAENNSLIINTSQHGNLAYLAQNEEVNCTPDHKDKGGRKERTSSRKEIRLESVEKEKLENWKKDLIQIKADMQKRQHNYREVKQFYKLCQNKERTEKSAEFQNSSTRGRSNHDDLRYNSIYSLTNHNQPNQNKSYVSTPSQMTPPRSRVQQTSSKNFLNQLKNIRVFDRSKSPVQEEPVSPEFKIREKIEAHYDNIMDDCDYGFSTHFQQYPAYNTQPKSPKMVTVGQEEGGCNMF